jgi:cysteinyl-tRNA synthetase
MKHLGETFDIHGGGMDLIFPHHENEIAQSSGATGKEFARYWMHNGFVQINQEKMSKSLGNFNTIREIFKDSRWHVAETREVLRYFLLGTHYRNPLDFYDKSLDEAWNGLKSFYELLVKRLNERGERGTADKDLTQAIERCRVAFREAMDDDFNTPVAIAELHRLKSEVNKLLGQGLSTEARKIAREEFRSLGSNLGLFQLDKWTFVGRPTGVHIVPDEDDQLSEEQINQLVEKRLDARKKKNFEKADEIRQFLASNGIVIEDKPDGTSRWKR